MRAPRRSSPRTGLERSCSSAIRFPRYHVGESLLPALWELWDRLGVTEQIEAAGFVVKQGIRFARSTIPKTSCCLSAEYPEYFPRSYTYHVDRARFDALLLDNARAKGADVREGWTVSDVWIEDGWVKGVLAARTARRRARSPPTS